MYTVEVFLVSIDLIDRTSFSFDPWSVFKTQLQPYLNLFGNVSVDLLISPLDHKLSKNQ